MVKRNISRHDVAIQLNYVKSRDDLDDEQKHCIGLLQDAFYKCDDHSVIMKCLEYVATTDFPKRRVVKRWLKNS